MKFKLFIVVLLLFSIAYSADQLMGVQTHFGQFRRADMDSASVETQLSLCASAGFNIIRDECLWSDVELDTGVYTIPHEVDRYVRSAKSHGLDVYLILNYNNMLYAPSNGSGVTTETNRIAYAKYCQAVVSHFYPLGVTHYEIWNEPNHGVLFWTPQPNANDYTALLHTAYDSIKSIQPEATVIGCATSPAIGNPAPYIEGLDFIRDVFADGGADYMDAVSFHLYQVAHRPENELHSYLNSVKSYVGDMPIYLSETGYPTHSGWPNISLDKQARYVTRMFLKARLDDQLKGVFYYDLKNDGTVTEEPEHNFGLLNFNASTKPAYDALKFMQTKTGGRAPDGMDYVDNIYRYYQNIDMNILWSYSGTSTIGYQPQHWEDDYGFYNLYSILDMYGDTTEYHLSTIYDKIYITINENPIYCFYEGRTFALKELTFLKDEFLIYPGESIKIDYKAQTVNEYPLFIHPNALNWESSQEIGKLDSNVFTAESIGKTIISAELQGKRDSVNIVVIPDPGYHTVEDFSDTSGFDLESNHLNFDASSLSSDGSTLTINYEYNRSSASVYLNKKILINHTCDSIFLDMKTDDKEFEFRFYCKDATGQTFTLGAKPKPTNWINSWGTVSGAMTIPSTAIAPVFLEQIYIKMKPGKTTQSMPYSGQLILDNFRMKKGDAVGIAESPKVPKSIELAQNYPNPFNGITKVSFSIPENSDVLLELIDLQGRVVSTELNKTLERGQYEHMIDMKGQASGIYFYRLSTQHTQLSRKLAYVK